MIQLRHSAVHTYVNLSSFFYAEDISTVIHFYPSLVHQLSTNYNCVKSKDTNEPPSIEINTTHNNPITPSEPCKSSWYNVKREEKGEEQISVFVTRRVKNAQKEKSTDIHIALYM